MTDADRPAFAEDLSAFAVGHRIDATPVWMEFYWRALKDLPLDAVKRGLAVCARECRFMPKPAEIRERAGGSKLEDRAALAWLSVSKALALGHWTGVDFADPTVNAAVRMIGGWHKLCTSKEEWSTNWAPKMFKEAFVAVNRAGTASSEAMRPIEGLGSKVVKVPVEGYNPRTALAGRGAEALDGRRGGEDERRG